MQSGYSIKYLLCVMLCLLINHSNAQQKQEQAFLKGVVKNFSKQVLLEEISDYGALELPGEQQLINPDSAGNFSAVIEIKKSNYYRIGRNILFLSPGDKLECTIDRNSSETAKFFGSHQAENDYLKSTPFPKAGSFLVGGKNIKPTLQQTIDTIIQIADARIKLLEKFSSLSPTFFNLEKARVDADIVNSLAFIKVYFPIINKYNEQQKNDFYANYENTIIPYFEKYLKYLINRDYLELPVYRNIFLFMCQKRPQILNFQWVINWRSAERVFENIQNESIRNKLEILKDTIEALKDSGYKNKLLLSLAYKLKLNTGDTAVDFTMYDQDNKKINLSNFSGKTIYIDIWATWCGPCLKELPLLDSLRQSLKNVDSIVFMSLSIDDNVEQWKTFKKNKKLKGNQFIVSKRMLDSYYITEIPRAIIINKNFKIAALYAELPSSGNLKKFLESME